MTDDPETVPDLDPLQALAQLHEQPFHSDVPIIGGLIVWFRTAWNSISTKWYVRPIMNQQSEYNQAVLDQLARLDVRRREMQLLADDLDRRIAEQDREYTRLVRDLGETSARIVQLRAVLDALEDEGPSTGDR